MRFSSLALSLLRGDGSAKLHQALLRSFARRVERGVGLSVQRLAGVENAFEVGHRLGIALHRAEIALGDDTRHVLVRRCLYPDGEAMLQQEVVRVRLRD